MVMSAIDLVEHHPHGTEREIREGLEGNLCRCTGYQNIVKAVAQGARRWANREAAMNDPTPGFIGKAVERKEDRRFLTGQGQFTDDITQPNQSYAVFVRSPHAHATIRGIDTKAGDGRRPACSRSTRARTSRASAACRAAG